MAVTVLSLAFRQPRVWPYYPLFVTPISQLVTWVSDDPYGGVFVSTVSFPHPYPLSSYYTLLLKSAV